MTDVSQPIARGAVNLQFDTISGNGGSESVFCQTEP